jgi:hypothetical protein
MEGRYFAGVALSGGRVDYRRRLWRWAWVAPLFCCVACVRPLPPGGRDEVIHRELSELIVSGTVSKVRDSRFAGRLHRCYSRGHEKRKPWTSMKSGAFEKSFAID